MKTHIKEVIKITPKNNTINNIVLKKNLRNQQFCKYFGSTVQFNSLYEEKSIC